MEIGKAIKTVMKEKGMTQWQMAEYLTVRNQSVISRRLRTGSNLSCESILEMLEALDYELIIQPKLPDTRYIRQIKIDSIKIHGPS